MGVDGQKAVNTINSGAYYVRRYLVYDLETPLLGSYILEGAITLFPPASAIKGLKLLKAYHHTADEFIESITKAGLRPGSYATPIGGLSPLQAKIELALPGNLPRNSILEIDLDGLRNAGYVIPDATRVKSYKGLPGGGYEIKFPYALPPEYIRVIQP